MEQAKRKDTDIALKVSLLEKGVKEVEAHYTERGLTDDDGKLLAPRIEYVNAHGYVGSIPQIYQDEESKTARFRVAIKFEDLTHKWVTVSLKGDTGVKIAKAIEKGMCVYVSGRLFHFPNPKTGDEETGRKVIFANQIFRLLPLMKGANA